MKPLAVLLLLLSPAVSAQTLAIANTTIVDPEQGVQTGLTVVIEDGRIRSIDAAGTTPLPDGARVVDGTGRFLVPGLVDAHVHMIERDAALYLSKGVTTIRELNGNPEHLALRERIARGERIGPRLLVTSPLLAGAPVQHDHTLLTDPETALERVFEYIEAGYDALKVYDGLSAEVYSAILDLADESGIPVTGHIPADVGLRGVLERGQNLEHVEKLVQVARSAAHAEGGWAATAQEVADAGVVVSTTLAAHKFLALANTEEFARRLERPEVAWINANTRAWWESYNGAGGHAEASTGVHGHSGGGQTAFYHAQLELTQALWRAGVPLLAGTDTPHPLLVPGYSLHEELACLAEAGLDPLAILRSATSVPSRALGIDGGVIAEGGRADLLLVAGDPLEDLIHLANPVGVILAGRWLTPEDLLAQIEADHAR